MASSRSTTASATRWVIRCWWRSPSDSKQPFRRRDIWSRGWEVMSSSSSSRTPVARRMSSPSPRMRWARSTNRSPSKAATFGVTASAGLVERESTATAAADLMRAADITLYWAKADGKGRWALFDAERDDRDVAQYTLTRMLPAALEHDEFRLYYQPLFNLRSGMPCGVEALLRWEHPRLGHLLPARFIAAAEESGIIVPLGQWALETACRQAGTLGWSIRRAAPSQREHRPATTGGSPADRSGRAIARSQWAAARAATTRAHRTRGHQY